MDAIERQASHGLSNATFGYGDGRTQTEMLTFNLSTGEFHKHGIPSGICPHSSAKDHTLVCTSTCAHRKKWKRYRHLLDSQWDDLENPPTYYMLMKFGTLCSLRAYSLKVVCTVFLLRS